MSVTLMPGLSAPKTATDIREDLYRRSLLWVWRERAGAGGWPPTNISRVSGWTVIKLIAAVHERSVSTVAAELIELHEYSQDDKQWP
jgi:hypothetical protein